jgi:uncharacterized protein
MKRFLKSCWTVFWKLLLFLVVWGVLLAPFIFLFRRAGSPDGSLLRKSNLLPEAATAAAILAATAILVRLADRRPWKTAGFAAGSIVKDAAAGLAVGSGIILTAVAFLRLAGCARLLSGFRMSAPPLAVMAGAVLFNAVTQEVLVRGYFFQVLRKEAGAAAALILTSLVFTFLHDLQGAALPAVNLFLAGILLGIGVLRTGNLWLSIALHFAWNFWLGPLLGLSVSGQSLDCGWRVFELAGPKWLTGGLFGLEGGLAATAATLLGIILILPFRRAAAAAAGRAGSRIDDPEA